MKVRATIREGLCAGDGLAYKDLSSTSGHGQEALSTGHRDGRVPCVGQYEWLLLVEGCCYGLAPVFHLLERTLLIPPVEHETAPQLKAKFKANFN